MQQEANSFGKSIVNALKDDRRSLYGGDLLRSVLFILLAAGLLAYWPKKNISTQIVVIGLVVLVGH